MDDYLYYVYMPKGRYPPSNSFKQILTHLCTKFEESNGKVRTIRLTVVDGFKSRISRLPPALEAKISPTGRKNIFIFEPSCSGYQRYRYENL